MDPIAARRTQAGPQTAHGGHGARVGVENARAERPKVESPLGVKLLADRLSYSRLWFQLNAAGYSPGSGIRDFNILTVKFERFIGLGKSNVTMARVRCHNPPHVLDQAFPAGEVMAGRSSEGWGVSKPEAASELCYLLVRILSGIYDVFDDPLAKSTFSSPPF
ncbi:hypothetical protein [Nitrospirillum iridis]|uniref:Uncharacterized protein n=1 Tax=Nitrospirillum iridis TaxID=765888 RepID=A0A7X0B137_9PROT|nr:hypothetical protein [Nitrospirillum iridis]